MPLISWLLAAKRRYRTAQGERSGTLGNSYQLGSALKERQKLPANKRASFVVPFCSSFRAGRFILYNYPGFRYASPWAEIFNRFAVLLERHAPFALSMNKAKAALESRP